MGDIMGVAELLLMRDVYVRTRIYRFLSITRVHAHE